MDKSPDAFRTISEVSAWLETPAHVLRFWESRFSQIKPVKRAGGRRYYRPADMQLLGGIKKLLHEDGLTIRGVQKILREEGVRFVADLSPSLAEGPLIEGETTPDLPPAPEAPMHENAEAVEDPANVVALSPRARRARTQESLPGLDQVPDAATPDMPQPAPPPPEAAPPAAEPTQEAAEADAETAPRAATEQTASDAPTEAPQDAAKPDDTAPATPETPAPRPAGPLGTDLPETDPADDDPAFVPPYPAARTRLRAVAVRRALAADPARAQGALARLRALAARMDDQGQRPEK